MRCKVLAIAAVALALPAADLWVDYPGGKGPGAGKHIAFVTGDDEYRSEESIPVFARMLSERHGFRTTVLFAIDPATGEISPETQNNIPGLEALDRADLMVLFARFRELPDDQMKHIVDYTNSGRPIIGLRTATHPFNYEKHQDSPYAKYSFRDKTFEGGYGRQVLGETWVNHYGVHQKESTRGLIAPGMEKHPILIGFNGIWGASDVYAITTLTGDSKPVVMGQVLMGMTPDSPPNSDKVLTPVAWVKTYQGARVFTTTMGHAEDFQNEGFRRMVTNACYWALKMEDQISPASNVALTRPYHPTPIGFHNAKKSMKPADYR
jgi:type 1 glutamine amidotransferase